MTRLLLLLCALLTVFTATRADESYETPVAQPTRDPRLPPLMPGEPVKMQDGSTMKIWSSAGGVQANRPPQPPAAPGNVDVIIDRRDREFDHRNR